MDEESTNIIPMTFIAGAIVIPFPKEFCIIPVTSEENKQAIA
tara:strand:- start:1557 stop:1682 length:126 start_codon:yes stop_codon:yes gene_type:complete